MKRLVALFTHYKFIIVQRWVILSAICLFSLSGLFVTSICKIKYMGPFPNWFHLLVKKEVKTGPWRMLKG